MSWYETCRQAGFLLSPNSQAIVANNPALRGATDIHGNPIEYIGACPPVKTEPAQKVPEPPLAKPLVSRIIE